MSRHIDLNFFFGIVFSMKFYKFFVISFIILNYFSLGCFRAPIQIPETPTGSLSKFDQELFERAKLHQGKGQIESAIVLWKKFLQRSPNSYLARNNLGLLYYANDDITQAIYHFEEGIKLSPAEIQLKVNLVRALKVQAVIFEENGEYNVAIKDLRRVVQLTAVREREDIERQIEALEDLIFKQVQRSGSIEEYQEFLKRYPNSPGNSDEARLWVEKKLQAEKIKNRESRSNNSIPSLAIETK